MSIESAAPTPKTSLQSGPDLEVECEQTEAWLVPSCLRRSERLLEAGQGKRLAECAGAFVEAHSDHRSVLDYLAGLVFPALREPMQAFYDDQGPELVAVHTSQSVRQLDLRLVEALEALVVALGEVDRQAPGTDPEELWVETCRLLGLDPYWFA